MATPHTAAARSQTGANLVLVAGVGIFGYGLIFLYRNFHGFIELGLTVEQVGATPEQIQAVSMNLYHYIGHLQVALAGFLMSLGVAVVGLAWYGIRAGYRWAVWAAFLAPATAIVIGLPLHYVWGFGSMAHLGFIYLDTAVLLVGTALSLRATG